MTRLGNSLLARLFGRSPSVPAEATVSSGPGGAGSSDGGEAGPRGTTVEARDGFAADGSTAPDDTTGIATPQAPLPGAGTTAGHSPQGMVAKLEQTEASEAAAAEAAKAVEAERAQKLCQAFLADRHALDDDPSVEWVEGWHGVHKHNVREGVPGILEELGLFVNDTVHVRGAYWHKKRPEPPDTWMNSGAMVHFRIPKLYLETQGKFTDHPVNGQIFRHPERVNAPKSSANPNQELMPVQVLEVYWVRGKIPETCDGIGVDLIGAKSWPADREP